MSPEQKSKVLPSTSTKATKTVTIERNGTPLSPKQRNKNPEEIKPSVQGILSEKDEWCYEDTNVTVETETDASKQSKGLKTRKGKAKERENNNSSAVAPAAETEPMLRVVIAAQRESTKTDASKQSPGQKKQKGKGKEKEGDDEPAVATPAATLPVPKAGAALEVVASSSVSAVAPTFVLVDHGYNKLVMAVLREVECIA